MSQISGGIHRLVAHTTLQQLAFGVCGTFSAAFLLRVGLTPAQIFLTLTAMLAARFAFRPLVLVLAPRFGLQRLLIAGTILSAMQYVQLAAVRGIDSALLGYCVITAVANTFYWTSYHALFALVGASERRARQVGVRQVLSAGAGVVGPLIGGTILTLAGPWAAFGTAALVACAAALPLRGVTAPDVPRRAPAGAYAASRKSLLLFATDGWIMSTAAPAWSIIMFQALGGRYDSFGLAVATAAFAGAVGGMVFGFFIDRGNAQQAVLLNAALVAAALVMRIGCGSGPTPIFITAILSTLLSGAYVTLLMTAVYDETKGAPCAFRTQFAAEGGWDVSGAIASLAAAAIAACGLPLQWAIAIALFGVGVQFCLLKQSYRQRLRRTATPA
jgi:hypothetical protein